MNEGRVVLFCSLVGLGCSGPMLPQPPLDPDEGALHTPPPAVGKAPIDCLKEGTEIIPGDAKTSGAECCEGLTRAPAFKGSILRLETCEPEDSGHAFCIRCGDGHCGVGENTCSCEVDCRWP